VHGSVIGFPEADLISNVDLLELPCEILVPAALGNQITGANAARIQARIIGEAANGPTTPEADAILYDRGVLVLPDILATAGGLTVSYFEWVQNLQDFFWSEREVNAKLERVMRTSFEQVGAIAQQRKVHLRTAPRCAPTARSVHESAPATVPYHLQWLGQARRRARCRRQATAD
jgi:glutamate dehydrogenase (NAD(P)+)